MSDSTNKIRVDVMHMLVTQELPTNSRLRASATSLEYAKQSEAIAQYIQQQQLSLLNHLLEKKKQYNHYTTHTGGNLTVEFEAIPVEELNKLIKELGE